MPIRGDAMKSSERESESQSLLACQTGLAGWRANQSRNKPAGMKGHGAMLLVVVTAVMAAQSVQARSQSLSSSGDYPTTAGIKPPEDLDLTYVRPTEGTKAKNYIFDAFGPYPIAGAAFTAGIDQFSNAPPEWNQGVEGFSKRFGSEFAIAAIGTTTRYGLAEALKEDTLYYRCECRGVFPRLRHAVISTVTARRGEDGHLVFSLPALIAPYVGSMAAVYGWFPDRFGAKDAFRMGNYRLLAHIGGNIPMEFFYSGPHSLLSRMHLNNGQGSTVQGPN
jgi:hypothetical protein